VLAVPRFSSSSSETLDEHSSTQPRIASVKRAISAGERGSGVRSMNSRISAGVKHTTGALLPTPRGSQLTSAKRLRNCFGKAAADCLRKSTPPPPGPPGLITTVPIGFGLSAGARITASSIVSLSGSSWSTGTESSAHSNPPHVRHSSGPLAARSLPPPQPVVASPTARVSRARRARQAVADRGLMWGGSTGASSHGGAVGRSTRLARWRCQGSSIPPSAC
jgi:hypothetical protein